MTPKNRTLEGKNWTLGGRGGQKSSKIVGHHLCTFPNYVAHDITKESLKNSNFEIMTAGFLLRLKSSRNVQYCQNQPGV